MILAILLLALALAMDAFAVAATQGASFRPSPGDSARIALLFGLFQGVMPLIGWALGAAALDLIAPIDHWIAFVLLGFLGVRMIRGDDDDIARPLAGWPLFVAAIATSVDALAAGITFPALGLPPIETAIVIALVTAIMSWIGVAVGAHAGDRFGRPAEIVGGLVLIALGVHILAEHLGWPIVF